MTGRVYRATWSRRHDGRMRLLILGGTWFLGRTLAEHALAQGWQVTYFNRGRTARTCPVRDDRTSPGDVGKDCHPAGSTPSGVRRPPEGEPTVPWVGGVDRLPSRMKERGEWPGTGDSPALDVERSRSAWEHSIP
jgi:hypothetical protein